MQNTSLARTTLRDTIFTEALYAVWEVAVTNDGQFLACGSYLQGVYVWDMTTHSHSWIGRTQPTRIRRVAWSPDGTQLVCRGDGGYVYLWDAKDGEMLRQWARHNGVAMSAIRILALSALLSQASEEQHELSEFSTIDQEHAHMIQHEYDCLPVAWKEYCSHDA